MVLHRLLERPDASKFEITALVRSAEKAEKLAKFGVKTVVGSLDETAKIEELVGRADYVFQCVSPVEDVLVRFDGVSETD